MIQLNQESYRDCQKVIINERGLLFIAKRVVALQNAHLETLLMVLAFINEYGSLFIVKGIMALQKASLKKHFEWF